MQGHPEGAHKGFLHAPLWSPGTSCHDTRALDSLKYIVYLVYALFGVKLLITPEKVSRELCKRFLLSILRTDDSIDEMTIPPTAPLQRTTRVERSLCKFALCDDTWCRSGCSPYTATPRHRSHCLTVNSVRKYFERSD